MANSVDVIVVGAGLAGLTAALRLRAAGARVAVLESRDRVGGRTLNHALGADDYLESGGQFVGPTQDRVLGLAAELRVGTFAAFNAGKSTYVHKGRARRFDNGIPPDPTALLDVGAMMARIDRATRSIPVDAPWTAPDARELDAQTFAAWARRGSVTAGGLELLDVLLGSAFGASATDASALFGLWYVAGAGDKHNRGTVDRMMSVENGAQERRFVGGAHRLSLRLAEELGDAVVLGDPVRRIEQSTSGAGAGATVRTDRRTWTARDVVVAIPPVLATRIQWDPLLPAGQEALFQRMSFGNLAKVEAVYEEPFWRRDGLSGEGVFRAGSPVCSMFDNSSPDPDAPGVLMGFVGANAWREWAPLPAQRRRGAVLRSFSQVVGPRALRPVAVVEQDWTAEEWTRGGPTSVLAPGVLTGLGRWRDVPFGRVRWAGAEHANHWNGYMDGAVRSGESAAASIVAAIDTANTILGQEGSL